MPRDRGIDDIEEYSGDFLQIIAARVESRRRVRILEAGCGHGVAMMGLIKRFGDSVSITGFNYSRRHGTVALMKQQAVAKEIVSDHEIRHLRQLPRIVYCDADKRLPFSSRSFEFIYSRSALYLFRDKIAFLTECHRLLASEGLCRIDPSFGPMCPETNPREFQQAWEIWDHGEIVAPDTYLASVPGLTVGHIKGRPRYVQIEKSVQPRFGLKFLAALDVNFIWTGWSGVKSIYSTQVSFDPHWR